MRSAVAIALTITLLSVACGGEEFSSTEAGAGGNASSSGPGGGNHSPEDSGCSDGQREDFLDPAQTDIAACAGGFSEPGVHTPASLAPQCARTAGDDGDNPDGNGCSVADLCAAGWHVCETAADVAQRSATAKCAPSNGDATALFWLSRQAQDALGDCAGALADNNLVGCGQLLGQATSSASCAPLDREMRFTHCEASTIWRCGAMATANIEAQLVHKVGPEEGGVLCCRD